ncbi:MULTISPECIES: hypothetical protein [Cryobacterium]|uniref:GAF domain-containing protein n=1 Tax=Cryobacterium breve TaxID=1259258 RepID=A0ABY2J8T1_9MICO|nr:MULTISPECIES: hypothetical protein [Cryobacterium]TFC91333.1 hypothetical protein E3T20_13895 [Cryobacterium sp. TmT3-12]TFD01358.1 hypothetical protein E3O65_01550 [Cryobacterium breve]
MTVIERVSPRPVGKFKGFWHAATTTTSHFLSREGIKTTWHEPLILTGTVASLYVGVVNEDHLGYFIGGAAALLIVGNVRGLYTKSHTIGVEGDRDLLRDQLNGVEEREASRREQFAGAVAETLQNLATELQVWNSHSRLTLYTFNGSGFQLFRRKSDNPMLEAIGRGFYPLDQGILRMAWERGVTAAFTAIPTNDPDYGKKLQKDFNIPIGTSKGFGMRSASILAARLSDTTSASNDHIGVLVIESTAPRGVTSTVRTNLMSSKVWHALQVQVSTSREYLPDILDAQKRGF